MQLIEDEKKGGPNFQIIKLWLLLIPIFFILPNLGAFPFPGSGDQFSDITVSHLPNLIFLQKALAEYRSIPLWSPLIMSGYPFFADPISGLHYPPGWLGLLLPQPFGFNVLIIVHILWGGIGMYKLGRLQGLNHAASLLTALGFELMPKIFAHYGAGHVTLMYAIPWTPWLLFFSLKSWMRRSWSPIEAVILAMIFLADPRWAPYAGLLWLSYGIFLRLSHGTPNRQSRNWRWLPYQLVLCGLLMAPLAIPLWEYTNISTRASLRPDDILALSFPPIRILGLIYPDFGGFHEWIIYPGSVVLVFSLVAIINKWSNNKLRFWGWVALLSFLFALGDFWPIGRMLTYIPGLNLLRVPARALFLFGFALAILAGFGFDQFIRNEIQKRAMIAITSLGTFVGLMTIGIFYITKRLNENFVWGGVSIILLVIWMVGAQKWLIKHKAEENRGSFLITGVLFMLLLLDLGGTNATLINFYPSEVIFGDGEQVASFLASKPGRFRVYSPSYSLPQTAAARAGLELADGVHPMQLAEYYEYMERASGVHAEGYSVTIPPFSGGDPSSDNREFSPNASLLGLLNVGYITSEFDLSSESLIFLEQIGDTRIYKNEAAHERAWIIRNKSNTGDNIEIVEIIEFSPNKIVLEVEGPGKLVLSEVFYPGWIVTVNGIRRSLEVENGILRAVELEDPFNRVIFTFRPLSLYLGLGISLLGVSIVAFHFFKRWS